MNLRFSYEYRQNLRPSEAYGGGCEKVVHHLHWGARLFENIH